MIPKNADMGVITYQLKVIIILTWMGLLAFWATLHSPFLYDDAHAIVDNPYIQHLSEFQNNVGIQNIFNRSVLLLSFAVNREIGNLDVFGYHLFNVLLHILTGLTWYFLVRELLLLEPSRQNFRRLPLVCSSIHLLHPLAVETVTYISSRSSGLATFFYLLAFYIFCRLVRPRKAKLVWTTKLLCIVSILAFLFLGIGTKEIVATFPLIAVIYVWLITPKSERRFLKFKIGAILIPLVFYFCYRYMEQGNIFSVNADPVSGETSRFLYFLSQIKVIVNYYLFKLFLPFNLNFEPDIRLLSKLMNGQLFLAFGVLGVGLIIIALQKSPVLFFAVLWFFITLLPSSSFIPLKQIATEHRTYLPALGFHLALGWALLNLFQARAFSIVFLILFISLNFLLTVNRTLDYRSEVTLWEDTIEKSPNKALAHNNLATAYMEKEMFKEAEKELAITLRLDPGKTNAYSNFGHISFQRKDWEKAIESFDQAIALGSDKPDTFYFSGLARSRQKSFAEAIPYLQEAVRMRPYKAQYHFNLGNAYRHIKSYDQALLEFRQTLQIQPDHPQARNNIGVIFWNLKAFEKAEREFHKALEIQQDLPEIHQNLAAMNILNKQYANAIPHLEKVLKIQPENVSARQLLDHVLGQLKKGTNES